MCQPVVWCDLPVLDLDRAIAFYSAVLGLKIKRQSTPESMAAVIEHQPGAVSVCLTQSAGNRPSGHGPLLYLNVNSRMQEALDQVLENGGEILEGTQSLGAYGNRAIIRDSEGNSLALSDRGLAAMPKLG